MRYPLAGLLTVAVCAVLAGASSFAAITDWLHDLDDDAQHRLGFARGAPVGTTVWRLLTRLDADVLTTVLAGWLRTRARPVTPQPKRYRTVIAVDGKTLRGARRKDGGQVHLLSALDTSTTQRADGAIDHPVTWSLEGAAGDKITPAGVLTTVAPGDRELTVRAADDSGAKGIVTVTVGTDFTAPRTVTAVQHSQDDGATVTWSTPTSTGGSAISGYTVVTDPPTGPHTVTAGTTSLDLAGLEPGTSYFVSVYATNGPARHHRPVRHPSRSAYGRPAARSRSRSAAPPGAR